MAIGLLLNSHPSHTQMAIRLTSDSHSSLVRWPSDGGKHTFSVFATWQTPVFSTLLVRRIIVFQEEHFSISPIIQLLTTQKHNKNRVFPSKIFLAQKYTILARKIYSLTICQQSNKKTEIFAALSH